MRIHMVPVGSHRLQYSTALPLVLEQTSVASDGVSPVPKNRSRSGAVESNVSTTNRSVPAGTSRDIHQIPSSRSSYGLALLESGSNSSSCW